MKTIEDKLNEFSALIDGKPQPEEVEALACEIRDLCVTDADWQKLDDFMRQRIAMLDSGIAELKEAAIKLQLEEVSDMINLSYIAKKYFNKSRAWLSQRINGNKVNGKACRFTDSELATLNAALQDMSVQLAAVKVSY